MADVTSGPRNRLTEPSSPAGRAALLALLVPHVADQSPALVDLGLNAVAAGACSSG
jgi:hypothetical protein